MKYFGEIKIRISVDKIKPVVIYTSGQPLDGKSVVGYLLEDKKIDVFHTDEFFT